MSLKLYTTSTAINKSNSLTQNSFDTIQIKIDKFILGVSISVNVYFSNQSMIVNTINYTFLFSKTIPSYYGNQNQTSLYPYYLSQLQNGQTYPDPTSPLYPTIDLYILNGLVLPSLKNETTLDSNPFNNPNVTDITSISSPTISSVTYTNNLQYNYFTISFNQQTPQYITKYEISVNSDKIELQTPCQASGVILKNNPISTGQSYNISVYAKNTYTGSTGTYQITPVTVAPFVYDIAGPTGKNLYVGVTGSGSSNYSFDLYQNNTRVYGPTGTTTSQLSIPVSGNGFYSLNISALDSQGNTGPCTTSYINFTNYQ
jgi:hypothetical protein